MSNLPTVTLEGLRADSLGSYLASLGLFSLVTRKWPRVRAVWRNDRFCLIGGPTTLEQTFEFVADIGQEGKWTKYDKSWDNAKKADVKESGTSRRTACWRALEADELLLPAFGAHLALGDRVRMNPLLGTGGNAGKRDFAKGWKEAAQAIKNPPRGQVREVLNKDLKAFLEGGSCSYLNSFQAGSWFGVANKIYNHGNPIVPPRSRRGKKKPFRDGEITPWAMVLACEGLSYFAGSPSRQLGSQRQPKGAFPFVTTAMAPKGAGEASRVEAEIWAPVWGQPMAAPELRSLFLRGRAEIGGKGAVSSVAFAAGVMCRGVDAGIVEFRRFLLLHTTSAQTFESRLATVVPVPKTNLDGATMRAIQTIINLRDRLPLDKKVGQKWRFYGVRGSLEQALIDFSATHPGENRVEKAWALVDRVIDALAKVDQSRTFRSRNVRFQLLPGQWAMQLFQEYPPDREARLALAVSSMVRTTTSLQFIAYRLGVKSNKAQWDFPETVPARRIWSGAELTEDLGALAERRVMEASQQAANWPPFDGAIQVGLDDMYAWLVGEVDEERLRLWLDRLCVFDWGGEANSRAAEELGCMFTGSRPVVDGALALYALFRSLAHARLLRQILCDSGIQAQKLSTCAYLGRVIAMLRCGNMNAAVEVVLKAYQAMGAPLADFSTALGGSDPDRMLAALIIPVRDDQVGAVVQRWRSPSVIQVRRPYT